MLRLIIHRSGILRALPRQTKNSNCSGLIQHAYCFSRRVGEYIHCPLKLALRLWMLESSQSKAVWEQCFRKQLEDWTKLCLGHRCVRCRVCMCGVRACAWYSVGFETVQSGLRGKDLNLVYKFYSNISTILSQTFIWRASLMFYLLVPNHKDLDTLRSGPREDYIIKF